MGILQQMKRVNRNTIVLVAYGGLLSSAFVISCLGLCFSLASASSSEYWVRADHRDVCPSAKQCISIENLLNSTTLASSGHGSSTYIYFLPGAHMPTENGFIEASGTVRELHIVGETSRCHTPACNVLIDCSHSKTGLVLRRFDVLEIANIKLDSCGLDISWDASVNKHITTSIFLHNVVSATFSNVFIYNSRGFGFAAVATHELLYLVMTNTTITHSNRSPGNNSMVGGNMLLVLVFKNQGIQPKDQHRVRMTNCMLAYGVGLGSVGSTPSAGGLTIKTNPKIKIFIRLVGTFFNNNFGRNGSAFFVKMLGMASIYTGIRIENCSFIRNVGSSGSVYIESYIQVNRPWMISRIPYLQFLHSTFSENTVKHDGSCIFYQVSMFICKVLDDDYYRMSLERVVLLESINSTFERNIADHKGTVYLSIRTYMESKHAKRANRIIIDNNTFAHNKAYEGAALNIDCFTDLGIKPDLQDGNIELSYNTEFKLSNSNFHSNFASFRGGSISIRDESNIFYVVTSYYVGLLVYSDYNFYKCTFENNTANLGSAIMLVIPDHPDALSQLTYTETLSKIESSNFLRNKETFIVPGAKSGGSTVYIENWHGTVLKNVHFTENECRALHIVMAQLVIKGEVWIEDNKAPSSHGAGIYSECLYIPKLSARSLLILDETSALTIKNNHAYGYGGGIAVKSGCTATDICLYHYHYKKLSLTYPGRVIMSNNTAGIGGDSIYGGNLESDRCNVVPGFWNVFNISDKEKASAVSSPPYKVCICNNFPKNRTCSHYHYISIFPGQSFRVPVVGVGSFNYSSPAILGTRLEKVTEKAIRIEEWTKTQQIGLECKNITYVIYTAAVELNINMSIIIENYDLEYSTRPSYIGSVVEISIKNCPYGFETQVNGETCKCNTHLSKSEVVCNIENMTIQRKPLMWIGNFSNDIAVHKRCPYGYCRTDVPAISPFNQEEQCNFNRSGVLCGACRPGLSLVLGTSQCKKCSNLYLLLLIPFAVAGIALIAILLKCNLTVSTGTINGLIFYSNVLQANRTAFFPASLMNIPTYCLSIFIAWLNLDFGKEMCFAENINGYVRTWLQFVFPLYIWFLISLLIIICRYSMTISKFTGSNTVPVLATMLLLISYTKLVRAIFDSFSSIILETPTNGTASLWTIDGNYIFLEWPHMLLFMFALIILVTYVIPFTLVVVFSPIIQRYSEALCIKWMTSTLNPFIDSFQGPFKTKIRFWTGLLLVACILIVLTSSANFSGDPSMNLLVIIVGIIFLLGVWLKAGCVYHKTLPNVIELFFLFNLLLYAAVCLYLRANPPDLNHVEYNYDIAVLCMVGSTFVVFSFILGYHTLFETYYGKQLVGKILQQYHRYKQINRGDEQELDNIPQKEVVYQPPTQSVVDLSEPLLESAETS